MPLEVKGSSVDEIIKIKNDIDVESINLKANLIKQEVNLENQTLTKTDDEIKALEINELFAKSETLSKFRDNWFALYEKAINSDKKTRINQKIKTGRFRFNIDGNLEILSEFDTAGKTSKDLLNLAWKIQ